MSRPDGTELRKITRSELDSLSDEDLKELKRFDPIYRGMRPTEVRRLLSNVAEFNEHGADLFRELAACGVSDDLLWGNFGKFAHRSPIVDEDTLRVMLPVIVKWLPQMNNKFVRDAMVRHMADPRALPLLEQLRHSQAAEVREAAEQAYNLLRAWDDKGFQR